MNYLDNNSLQINIDYVQDKCTEKIDSLNNHITELLDIINGKDLQINKLKKDSEDFKQLAYETEEDYFKKMDDQNATIKNLEAQLANLKVSRSPCIDCFKYDDIINDLNKTLKKRTLDMLNVAKQRDELRHQIADVQTQLLDLQRTGTETMNEVEAYTQLNLHADKSEVLGRQDVPSTSDTSEVLGHQDVPRTSDTSEVLGHKDVPRISDPSQILILSDSHGRHCSSLLRNLIDTPARISSIVKPNATLDQVISDLDSLTKTFSKKDFVIIIGGTNNALFNKEITNNTFLNMNKISKKTNIILYSIPHWLNNWKANKSIFHQNNKIQNIIRRNSDIVYIDSNRYMSSHDYTSHGLHLNHKGKLKLLTDAVKVISMVQSSPNNVLNRDNTSVKKTSQSNSLNINSSSSFLDTNSNKTIS